MYPTYVISDVQHLHASIQWMCPIGISGGSKGGWGSGKGGASVPRFELHVTLRSTDDNPPPPLSGYRTKKTAAMAHLRML